VEAIEGINVALHPAGDESCPFCPGEKEKEWKTFEGEKNSSGVLRDTMNDPTRCGYAQQSGARPKDGKDGRQGIDSAKITPQPIFSHPVYGEYSNQAHHSISGNEIMKGHKIEELIKKKGGSELLGDTGYTINNCANGVYLPAYPKKFGGIWGKAIYPKVYPVSGGKTVTITNAVDDDTFKFLVMKPAMERVGQAHIGGHEGFYLETLDKFYPDYPASVKEKLTEIADKVHLKSKECPFCVEGNGKPKKPYVPPYKINQMLDNLSGRIEKKLTAAPDKWPYFISKFSKDYVVRLKGVTSKKHLLTQ
jgi:hypothetical protein